MTNDPKLSGLKQHLLSTFSIDQKSNTNLAKSFALESVMAELYPVLNSFVWVLTLIPQNVTTFGDKVFEEVIQLKWSSESRSFMQYDWCP